MGNNSGVSAVIGILFTIGILVSISVFVYQITNDLPEKEVMPVIKIDLEYDFDNDELKISHKSGDTIFNALTTDISDFKNIIIKVNGELQSVGSKAGDEISDIDGTVNFELGNQMIITFSTELEVGDEIKIIHVPSKSIIHTEII